MGEPIPGQTPDNQVDSNLDSKDLKDRIKILSDPVFEYVDKSPVPPEVTASMISEYSLPENLSQTCSFAIEDFIVNELEGRASTEDEIVSDFLREINQGLGERLRKIREEITITEITGEENTDQAKLFLVQKMQELGLGQELIEKINQAVVTVTAGLGTSHPTPDNATCISFGQIRRKAIDLCSLDGKLTVEQVESALLENTIKHELGHLIDKFSGGISSKIPLEWEGGGKLLRALCGILG